MAEARQIPDRAEFADVLLEAALAAAERTVRGGLDMRTLAPGGGEVAEFEIAVPLSIKIRVQQAGGTGGDPSRMPPGTICCVCTRDASGQIRCWGSGPSPCC